MKPSFAFLFAVLLPLPLVTPSFAIVLYVDAGSANPSPPYANWTTAAASIQAAVDAALPGDEIVVTNGVYASGGRAVYGTMTNRVAVDKPLTLRSVNGPEVTIIQGLQVPGGPDGNGARRCVYLAAGAFISGFTLTNGATQTNGDLWAERSGGGIYCEAADAVISNCVVVGNSAQFAGGGCLGGTVIDSTLSGNKGQPGGGTFQSVLANCTLMGNSGNQGGATYNCSLTNCTVTGNVAWQEAGGVYGGYASNCLLASNSVTYDGGGASQCTLDHCTLTGNSGGSGGGATGSTLINCILSKNYATDGGGTYGCSLVNCFLTANSAANAGGGATFSVLTNCTVTGNSSRYIGGVSGSSLYNCIVYYNISPLVPNYDTSCTFDHCCTFPEASGNGNISSEPLLASAYYLSPDSPCRAAGSTAFAVGTDIDGQTWQVPPSMGCYEYSAAGLVGPLSVTWRAAWTNVATGFPLSLEAVIQGRAEMNVWDFGDGMTATNRPFVIHAWTAPGDYPVILRVYNETYPEGVSATGIIHVLTQVGHVSIESTDPVPPYLSWATAATNIQDAVDAACPGSEIVVSNGVYVNGGRALNSSLTNRVAVDKPLTLRSVNGPQFTFIQGNQIPGSTNGDGALRCVYLTNGASLIGFTLTNGATRASSGLDYLDSYGGGILCDVTNTFVSNCVFVGNSASGRGGGVYRGALDHCAFSANSSFSFGGGAFQSTLNDCSLIGNSALIGGGAAFCTLNACLLENNTAQWGGGASDGSTTTAAPSVLNNCLILSNSAQYAGGVVFSTLNNCAVFGNSASKYAGGALSCNLKNCTLAGNAANLYGGGMVSCQATNSIIYYNAAPRDANWNFNQGSFGIAWCCTTPEPTNGFGNITGEPMFVDLAGQNFHLQSNSPCINAGNNAFVTTVTDLDGNQRIVSGTVDIGAYEYQGTGSRISYAWLQQYGLLTDGSEDFIDSDRDGLNNWQEWRAGTNPTNAQSVLKMLSANPGPLGVSVQWQGVSGITYYLQRSTQLSLQSFSSVQSNLVGQAGVDTFLDTNAPSAGPVFYRVGVQ